MAWWGKLVGGAFGFMLGGPLGALMGAALGHNLDKGLDGFSGDSVLLGAGETERVQTAFFTAIFSVMGHMAKADGRVTHDELDLARNLMIHMQLSPDQRKAAMNLFGEGKQSQFPLDDVLDQFRNECRGRRNLIQMFLEMLVSTALADGEVHSTEKKLLVYISGKLGFSHAQFEQLLSLIQAQQQYTADYDSPGKSREEKLKEAYAVLGVSEAASDEQVKRAYRKLMNEHHPDKLVSKGLPEEMMKIATEKTQEIKAAYEQIKAARK
ncbi:MAG: co-chaperone DjlA [Gammaproteobacteria bacterium]|nr:co-chaperone DjlA [Gammaproteobacteria bacterium]